MRERTVPFGGRQSSPKSHSPQAGADGLRSVTHTSVIVGKEVTTNHPVSFVSGMFHGSQLNWAAMTKEAYAIYMTIEKSMFYLTDQEITLRSDHLPLKRFLNCKTLNNTVDNWAVEIESFKINFIHIAGKDNVLADTLSRLIDIDPDVVLEPELKDYEFGHYAFETLSKVSNCCLYVDRLHILYPHQEQISGRSCYSLEKSYFFPVQCLQEVTV